MWSRKEQNISGFDRFDGERAHVSRKHVVEAMVTTWVCFAVWTPAKVRHRRGHVEE